MRRYGWLVGLVVFAVVLLCARQLAWLVTEWAWFREVGYPQVFWTRFWARVAVGLVVGLVFAAGIGINLLLVQRWASRRRWRTYPVGWVGLLLNWLETGFRNALLLIAAAFGVVTGVAAARHWELVLQFWYGFRTPAGVADPIFGKDISFYLFALPFWRFLYDYLFAALIVALLATAILYGFYAFADTALAGRYPTTLQGQVRTVLAYMTPLVRAHLLTLLALVLFALAGHFRLSMFELLYRRGPGEVVWGIGYTDAHVRLPVLWVLMGVFLVGGVLVLWSVRARAPVRAGIGLAIAFAGAWLVGTFLPTLFQHYVVKPNELAMEKTYLTYNIRMTRVAYGIHNTRIVDYPFRGAVTTEVVTRNKELLDSVRLWDYRPLQDTLRQRQAIRTYYTFVDVDIDRYWVGGAYRQVMLAVRELDVEQLRPSWFSRHFLWTHGYGVVVVPVNEVEQEGMPVLWVQDIPPRSRFRELQIKEPRIYFGELTNHYIVVRTRQREFDYPKSATGGAGEAMARTTYRGRGGVPIGNWLMRVAFALRFGEPSLALNRDILPQSRLLFRRQIHERVRAIAPFLLFDRDPYIVIAGGRLYWLMDAYTYSDRFPYAEPATWEQTVPLEKGEVTERVRLNYIRNAVKVVIDAYHGTVQFYIADPTDPIVRVYARIFPGMFRPLSAMPKDLQAHLRYPANLLQLQAERLLLYHVTDPEQFYQQEDRWAIAQEVYGETQQPVEPYYVMMRLPDRQGSSADRPIEFALILPFTPYGEPGKERHNLVALLMARCDLPNIGDLFILRMPAGEQVYGPAQIEARIDNDAEISKDLTLWRQRGSDIIRGNLLVVPLDGALLYVEPLFLVAAQTRLPELKRVIVADQQRVVMDETLPKALARLLGQTPSPPPVAPDGQRAPDLMALATEIERTLTEAEESARRGDWARFGERFNRLRTLVQQLRQRLSGATVTEPTSPR
ncbi:hypothetical protein HRbin17_00591 [bacterium HR17]|uniref:UPF0182 protein HRbin17_00591 n=1 Tax=Candidatus Fervidibacter japonicus TaxID=2035412 RepID=A0A2H5XAA0_9BACT|nr:hypothetical protein HRbin17_00591 [bacterium HR17]